MSPFLWSTTGPNVPAWYRAPNSTHMKSFHTSTEFVYVCVAIRVGRHHSLTRREGSSGAVIYKGDWSVLPMPVSSRPAGIVVKTCRWSSPPCCHDFDQVTAGVIGGCWYCTGPSAGGGGPGDSSGAPVACGTGAGFYCCATDDGASRGAGES